MREETENWWKQALEDLDAARANREIGKYFVCGFLSQQAAEKALKAVLMATERESFVKTHSLISLAKTLSLPLELQSAARRLNAAYVTSRYPDAANGVPAEIFDEGIARGCLADAQEIVEWARTRLG